MDWYYMFGGNQSGPISTDELVSKIISGELEPQVLVWGEGMDDFIAASFIPDINALITVKFESLTSESGMSTIDDDDRFGRNLETYFELMSIAMVDGVVSTKSVELLKKKRDSLGLSAADRSVTEAEVSHLGMTLDDLIALRSSDLSKSDELKIAENTGIAVGSDIDHAVSGEDCSEALTNPDLPLSSLINYTQPIARNRFKLCFFVFLWSVVFLFIGFLFLLIAIGVAGMIDTYAAYFTVVVLTLLIFFIPVLVVRMTIKGRLPGTRNS